MDVGIYLMTDDGYGDMEIWMMDAVLLADDGCWDTLDDRWQMMMVLLTDDVVGNCWMTDVGIHWMTDDGWWYCWQMLLLGTVGWRMMDVMEFGAPTEGRMCSTLLGWKVISAGWKAKTLPPFQPTYQLILQLGLPTNILDRFHIFCPKDTLEQWAADVTDYDTISHIVKKVHSGLCSAWCVAELHWHPDAKQDIPFENIQLFNCDALKLWALKYSIKQGDVGTVINILADWMLMFRGTGKMPKYADALFHLLMSLKRMDAQLWYGVRVL